MSYHSCALRRRPGVYVAAQEHFRLPCPSTVCCRLVLRSLLRGTTLPCRTGSVLGRATARTFSLFFLLSPKVNRACFCYYSTPKINHRCCCRARYIYRSARKSLLGRRRSSVGRRLSGFGAGGYDANADQVLVQEWGAVAVRRAAGTRIPELFVWPAGVPCLALFISMYRL